MTTSSSLTALLSVSDKTGVLEFARALAAKVDGIVLEGEFPEGTAAGIASAHSGLVVIELTARNRIHRPPAHAVQPAVVQWGYRHRSSATSRPNFATPKLLGNRIFIYQSSQPASSVDLANTPRNTGLPVARRVS